MKKLKILFMGSPEFAVPSLKLLAEGDHQIAAVVTRPDKPRGRGHKLSSTPVKEWAGKYQLPVLQPAVLNSGTFLAQIKSLKPDILVNVAYGRIIPLNILELPPLKSVNLHPSLLPRYRGAAPIQRAIINGDAVTGNTIIYLAEELDAGHIIAREEEIIDINDTAGTLGERLGEKGALLMARTINLLAKGEGRAYPQDSAMVTLAPPLDQTEEIIDWHESAFNIHNRVRAFNPRPGAYTMLNQRRLKIWKTVLVAETGEEEKQLQPVQPEETAGAIEKPEKNQKMKLQKKPKKKKQEKDEKNQPAKKEPGPVPGTIITHGEPGIIMQTGKGLLAVQELQQEGKKMVKAADFWRGSRLKPGATLG